MEALACGVPAVVSDLPVLREVTDGLASCVPVGDADALAAALADGGESARQRRRAWAATFTWQRCAGLTRDSHRRAVG